MWTYELLAAARRGNASKVARLVDDERVDVNSKDGVSVCVLCLLILVLFWDRVDGLLSCILVEKAT